MARSNQRSRLLHVLTQRLAQRRMKKVCAGVVTLGGFAHISVHDGLNLLSKMNCLASLHLMRAHALHGHHTSVDVGDNVSGAVAEDADIADLPAGVSVKRRVIEDDLALFSGCEFRYALTIFDDGKHFAFR